MAKKMNVSLKHVQIDKANTVVVAAVAIAAFVLVITSFAVIALLDLRSYQAQVIKEKEATRDLLESNLVAAEELQRSYQQFNQAPVNVIGGISDGDGQNDGSNARIVLDALPSSYDFPALITGIERILVNAAVSILDISGTDEEIESRDLGGAEPIAMPFSFEITTNYDSLRSLFDTLEQSTRPYSIDSFEMRGDDDDLTFEVRARSYFKPGITFELGEKVVQPE